MRTTLNLDDDLLDRAQKFTGLKKKTELVMWLCGPWSNEKARAVSPYWAAPCPKSKRCSVGILLRLRPEAIVLVAT